MLLLSDVYLRGNISKTTFYDTASVASFNDMLLLCWWMYRRVWRPVVYTAVGADDERNGSCSNRCPPTRQHWYASSSLESIHYHRSLCYTVLCYINRLLLSCEISSYVICFLLFHLWLLYMIVVRRVRHYLMRQWKCTGEQECDLL